MITRRAALLGLSAVSAGSAAPSYRIIDPHIHVWKKDPVYPWAEGVTPPQDDQTPEMMISNLRSNGVEMAVIIQVRYYLFDNSYVRDVVKKYPRYFIGVCRVNPTDPAAPDHLSRLVKEEKFQGVRLSPNGTPPGEWITDAALMKPLWKRCQDLKVPMTILSPITNIPHVAKLVEQFPDLTVVIDHMADTPLDQPEQFSHLLELARYPKVFVKTSHTWLLSKQNYPWADAQVYVKKLYDQFGPKRLMWASDWPMCESKTTYGSTLSSVRDDMKFLNEDDKGWILGKTAERVWKLR